MFQNSEKLFIFLKFKKSHGSEKSKNIQLIQVCPSFHLQKYNKLLTLYGFVLMQIYAYLRKTIQFIKTISSFDYI